MGGVASLVRIPKDGASYPDAQTDVLPIEMSQLHGIGQGEGWL
jgi:hypothetical protein